MDQQLSLVEALLLLLLVPDGMQQIQPLPVKRGALSKVSVILPMGRLKLGMDLTLLSDQCLHLLGGHLLLNRLSRLWITRNQLMPKTDAEDQLVPMACLTAAYMVTSALRF